MAIPSRLSQRLAFSLKSNRISIYSNPPQRTSISKNDVMAISMVSVPIRMQHSSQSSPDEEPFYGSPRPLITPLFSSLTPLQRLTVAVQSATSVFSDPARADSLAALGEVTGHVALVRMYDKMMSDPTGQRILRDRPLVDGTSVDFRKLAERKGTFGETYAKFMEQHGFDPDDRSAVKFISDPELAYVMLRYRQCHDFWHALCDLPPNLIGEIALKWVELAQTGLPVAALSATVGSLKLSPEDREILFTKYLPWAMEVGNNATFLMNVYYEEEFEEDVEVLRNRLGVTPAPK